MFQQLIAKLAIFTLKNKTLTGEAKARCMTALINNLHALPIDSIIIFNNQGTLLVNGKTLSVEQSVALRESAIGLSGSFARKIIREQLKFMAVSLGVHEGLTTEMIVFAKAALWVMQEEDKLIAKLDV